MGIHYLITDPIRVNKPVQLQDRDDPNEKYGTIVPLSKKAATALKQQIDKLTTDDFYVDASSQLKFDGEQIPNVFLNQNSKITVHEDDIVNVNIVNATFTKTTLDTKNFAGCIIKNSKLTNVQDYSNSRHSILEIIDSDLANLYIYGNLEAIKSVIIFEGKDTDNDLLHVHDSMISYSSLLPVNVKTDKTDTTICHLNNCHLTNVLMDSTVELDNVILQSLVKQQLVPVFKSWKIKNFEFVLNEKITSDKTIGNITLKLWAKDPNRQKANNKMADESIMLIDANNKWD